MLVPMIGLSALGAGCAPLLSPAEVYQIARSAGFPSATAVIMTAVAFRESAGCPTAHNIGSPVGAEDSYGLWQINVKAHGALIASMGITPQQLYDPATNAAVAFRLWGGNDANLNSAWYINRPGYREAYLKFMPAAQAAANAIEPGTYNADAESSYEAGDSEVLFTVGDFEVTTTQAAYGGAALLVGLGLWVALR